MSSEHFHTVVVGGGIAGLACAHRLARELGRDRVRLLEASDYLGGYVRTTHEQGYQLDWGPNGFLDREPKMLEWIRELGLEGELVQANQAAARRFLMIKGKLVELVGPPKFLVSPLLSISGRVRLLMEPLIPAKRDNAPESVFDFAVRRIGREAAETLVSAMVLGIFGGDAKQLSLQHCFPRMAAMEREHGGLFKAMLAKKKSSGGGVGGTLTSLRGGIGRLAERVAEQLGPLCRTQTYVSGIRRDSKTYIIPLSNGELVRTENVVFAVPASSLTYILREFASSAAETFSRCTYASIAVVCTGFASEPNFPELKGFGYLVPPSEKKETLGCLWTSSIFPESVPDQGKLLRTMVGGQFAPDVCDWSETRLWSVVREQVFGPLGIKTEPGLVRVFKHFKAIPQYGLDHGDVLKAADAAERAHPGLYFTGSAFRGVAMIDCVADAFQVAERVVAG